jgi:filamentous hemagglutinin family protein
MKNIFNRPQKLISIVTNISHNSSLELLVRSIVITLSIFSGFTIPASAEIIYEGGKVATQAGNTIDIPVSEGKPTPTGANLFHSFDKFNINAGQTANFISTPDIQNIFGRVNGANGGSLIDGKLQVTGAANLFLMNPAGIVFGKGASLDINGAFTATTAKAIDFGNGNWFNAVGANTYENLKGNPIGLAFTGGTPGSIFSAATLSNVQPGKSVTLVGGTVISTGDIKTAGGNISIATIEGGKYVKIKVDGSILSLELPTALPTSANSINSAATNFTPLNLAKLLTDTKVDLAATGVKNENGVVTLVGNPAANALAPDLDKAQENDKKARVDFDKAQANDKKAQADYDKALAAVGGNSALVDPAIAKAKDDAQIAINNSSALLSNSQQVLFDIQQKFEDLATVGEPIAISNAIALGDTVSKQNRSISSGDIITRNLDTSIPDKNGGNIDIKSSQAILSGKINTSYQNTVIDVPVSPLKIGGAVFLEAQTDLRTKSINTSARPSNSIQKGFKGGAVTLSTKVKDIIVDSIDTNAGITFGKKLSKAESEGLRGGDVTVKSEALFRVITEGGISSSLFGIIDIDYDRKKPFAIGVTFIPNQQGESAIPIPGFIFLDGVSGSRGVIVTSKDVNGSLNTPYKDQPIDGINIARVRDPKPPEQPKDPSNPDQQASRPKSKDNCTPSSSSVAFNPTAAPTRSAGNPNAVSADPCQPNTSNNGILQILKDRE